MLHENSKVSDNGTSRKPKAKRAARRPRRGGDAAPKVSLYDEVTAQIIAQLEKGVFPWVKPWNNRAIFKAASAASKAADCLLAFTDQLPFRSECAA